MAVSVEDVIQRIEDSGILDDAELSAVHSDAETAGGDSEKFVRVLVKNERLTAYQAQAIWRDKGHKLSFGNYIIEAELGRGGMGVVLKARHKRMKRYVAIKVLPATMTKDVDAVARFQREVEAAAQLTHPNIVGAHDADELNGQHFLVMEFVDGHDLSSVIKRNGPQSVEQAVNFTVQAARGLEFAHEQGVIHRDIKPANLLLDTKGTVKILDTGLARFSDNAEVGTQAELTGTGTVMGTVDYMSPEQALSTKTADARSDIYSLGITLYYLLTAKPAYEGDTLMARLLAHREHPIPSLRDDRPDIPDAVQHAFEKMVAKQADDRYQSMAEVIAALENCPIESAATVVDLSGVSPVSLGLPAESDLSKVLASGDESATDAESMAATATMPRADTNAPTIITSSISNTIQTNVTPGAGHGPSGSGRPAWMSGKRILAGAGVCVLLIVAFAMFSTETPEAPTGSDVASFGESRPTAKSSSTNRSATAPESVTTNKTFDDIDPAEFPAQRKLAEWVIGTQGGVINTMTRESLTGEEQWATQGPEAATIQSVAQLPKEPFAVWRIGFHGRQAFDDDALKELSILTQSVSTIRNINLGNTSITPQGIIHLVEFDDQLTNLGMPDNPQIDDTIVPSLSKLKRLNLLNIVHTGISTEGVERLRKVLPDCSIQHSVYSREKPLPSDATWNGWPQDAPAPAVAPFDSDQAKAHQKAWAAYLKVPVEYTNSIGMKFRLIPPGEFMMGSTAEEIAAQLPVRNSERFNAEQVNNWKVAILSEGPQHPTVLTKPFYLAVHEVTQAAYEELIGQNPSYFSTAGPGKDKVAGLVTAQHPVESLSWLECVEFCSRLSHRERFQPHYFRAGNTVTQLPGSGYRLPTEAEWEFASRGGTTTKRWVGDSDEACIAVAWFAENSGGRTHAVGELQPNPLGLYDILGNVSEWCEDGSNNAETLSYTTERTVNPRVSWIGRDFRSVRGGEHGWEASCCRSAFRNQFGPSERSLEVGFRIALEVDAVRQALSLSDTLMSNSNKPPDANGKAASSAPLVKIPLDLTPAAPLGAWEMGPEPPWFGQDFQWSSYNLRDANVLPGILDRPAVIPGIKRWNVDTVWPRSFSVKVAYSPDGQSIGVLSKRIRTRKKKFTRLRTCQRTRFALPISTLETIDSWPMLTLHTLRDCRT